MQAENSEARLDGTITTVFRWVPTPGEPGDLPPRDVIVTESCAVSGGGMSYGDGYEVFPLEGGHEADNGLGDPAVPSVRYFGTALVAYDSTSSGSHPKVMPGGQTVTVTCEVSARGSSRDNVSRVGAGYNCNVIPVQITLGGGIGGQGAKKYLIGQKVSAPVFPNLTSPTWSVSGGSYFKSYTRSQGLGLIHMLHSADFQGGTFECCFKPPRSLSGAHTPPYPEKAFLLKLKLM